MQTLDEFRAFVDRIGKTIGLAGLIPDEDGLCSLRVDDTFTISLQCILETNKVLCFVELMRLPADAPVAVYRELLAGGLFGQDTAGGYFALDPEENIVVYNYFFDADQAAKDPEECLHSLEDIVELCRLWVERIQAHLKGTQATQANPVVDNQFFNAVNFIRA